MAGITTRAGYEQLAKEALGAFHFTAASEFPSNMRLSRDEFIAWMSTATPTFLLDFGKSVAGTANLSGIGMDKVLGTMQSLARKQQGTVESYLASPTIPLGFPKTTNFYTALKDRSLSWDIGVYSAVGRDIAVQGVSAVSTAAKVALGGYTLYLVGFGLVTLYLMYKRAK